MAKSAAFFSISLYLVWKTRPRRWQNEPASFLQNTSKADTRDPSTVEPKPLPSPQLLTAARVALVRWICAGSLFALALAATSLSAQDAEGEEPNRGGSLNLDATDPEIARERLHLADGYEVNLFASEKRFPIDNPVSMTFDAKGRLWVVTMPSYPQYLPGEPPNDKLVILEDVDGDGAADRHIVFADGLHVPTGFELGDGGAYIAQQPDLIFAHDVDGDDVADERSIVLHGFGSEDSHHSISAFTWGPGGALYFQEGIFHNSQVETPYGPVRLKDAGVFRYKPQRGWLEVFVSYPFSNPWGHVFDRWGQNFIADASGGANYFGLPITGHVEHPRKHPRMKTFTTRVRPTAGCEIVSSRHFPDEVQGNFILNNCIGFQGVKQHRVIEEGSGFTSEEVEPILYSSDRNFRPVDLQFGPDGALYIADWFNPLVGHMQYSLRDERRDHTHGRIWRVTYKGRPLVKKAAIAGASIPELLELLKTYEDRTRYRVRRELRSHPRDEVAAHVGRWVKSLDASSEKYEHHLLEALWVHQTVNVVSEPLLKRLLNARSGKARAAATRVLRYWRDRIDGAFDLLSAQVLDAHPRVRLEAIVALSHFVDSASGKRPRSREATEAALAALRHERDDYIDYALRETIATLEPYWKPLLATGEDLCTSDQPGLEYLLGTLSTPDLLSVQRSPLVANELLLRHDVDDAQRRAALRDLTAARGTTLARESVAALARADAAGGEHAAHVVHALSQILHGLDAAEIAAVRGDLARLGSTATLESTRDLAVKSVIETDATPLRSWNDAGSDSAQQTIVLRALALAQPPELRTLLYPQVRALLDSRRGAPANDEQGHSVVSAAMTAIASMTEHRGEVVELLADFYRNGTAAEADAAVRAALLVRAEEWPQAAAADLAEAIAVRVNDVKPPARSAVPVQEALELANRLTERLPETRAVALRATLADLAVAVILIRTVPHQMAFDKTEIFVEAGKPVEIVVENLDIMPHNLLITAPKSMEEVGQLAERMATLPDAFSRHFIPDTPKVLHATKMLQPRQVARLSFVAPTETGRYPYVCTFPGHWRKMNGVMHVVSNLDSYRERLAADANEDGGAAEARPLVREWTVEDLLPALGKVDRGRSFERGKEMFTAAGCNQCHKLGDATGILGPDLSQVRDKMREKKMGRVDLLREIVEPSKVIAKEFSAQVIVTVDGQLVTGIVLEEDEKTLRIVTNPLDQEKPRVVAVERIAAREPSAVSLMPTGLLFTLTEAEILDLIAYVESAADASSPHFSK